MAGVFGDIGQGLLGVSKGAAQMGGLGGFLLGLPAMFAEGMKDPGDPSGDFAAAIRERTAGGEPLAQAFVSVISEKPELYMALPDAVRSDSNALMGVIGVGDATKADWQQIYFPDTDSYDYVNMADPNVAAEVTARGGDQASPHGAVGMPMNKERFGQEMALQAQGNPGAPVTNTYLFNQQETEESKKFGGATGEMRAKNIATDLEAASKAETTLQKLNAAESLISEVEQAGGDFGAAQPLQQFIGKWANALGVDPKITDKLGVSQGAVPAYQAMDSVLNEMTLGFIGADQGGLPASGFSEADREFARSIPGLKSETIDGLKAKMEYMRRLSQRRIEIAQEWDNYVAANGGNETSNMRGAFERDMRAKYGNTNLFGDYKALKSRIGQKAPKFKAGDEVEDSAGNVYEYVGPGDPLIGPGKPGSPWRLKTGGRKPNGGP